MKKNIIEIRNIEKSFHDLRVLEDINLDIKSGEFLTLLGPSGCGKTTLLRLIAGFETPDQGAILLDGNDISGVAPEDRRRVNMVFQSYALFPHMSVFENVAFGLRCKNLPNNIIQEKVDEALERVKLIRQRKQPHRYGRRLLRPHLRIFKPTTIKTKTIRLRLCHARGRNNPCATMGYTTRRRSFRNSMRELQALLQLLKPLQLHLEHAQKKTATHHHQAYSLVISCTA
jgi:ABC-type antimicrobial peptide transport system ATPase subunit